jgi:DNA-binding MarR family transcriptional regulator
MPKTPPKERAKRVIAIKLILGITRRVIELGDNAYLNVVMMAIRMGIYERKPLDLTAIAKATGLPRSTVMRHVQTLEELGRVKTVTIGRRSIPILSDTERAIVGPFYDDINRLILLAASNLSKLDSSIVDTKRNTR